jgi:hypothetical protein
MASYIEALPSQNRLPFLPALVKVVQQSLFGVLHMLAGILHRKVRIALTIASTSRRCSSSVFFNLPDKPSKSTGSG